MNRCVLKTFGKKMGIGTLKVIGVGLGYVAAVAVLTLVLKAIPDWWHPIIEEIQGLVCGVGCLAILPPLAIGFAVLEALKDSYKECGR